MDLRQLSIYSMICHLPTDPLHLHAHHVLTLAPPSANSWFQQVRDLCRKYGLPHPSTLLNNPMSKEKFKRLAKLKVTEYWRNVLVSECVHLESLTYFDPHKCSLQTPHPIWSSAASISYECNKAVVVARMVSGRYRTEMMCRFWSTNRKGFCEAGTCVEVCGDLEHLLVTCPALVSLRARLHCLWLTKSASMPALQNVLKNILISPAKKQVSFIPDTTSHPEIIHLVQISGQQIAELTLYLTRTMAYALHREKLILNDRWIGYPPKRGTNSKKDQKLGCLPNNEIVPYTNSLHFPGLGEVSDDQSTHIRTCACDLTNTYMLGRSVPSTVPDLLAWPSRSLPVLLPELCGGQLGLPCGSHASTTFPPSKGLQPDHICDNLGHGSSEWTLPSVGGPDDESEQWLSSSVTHDKPLCDIQYSPPASHVITVQAELSRE